MSGMRCEHTLCRDSCDGRGVVLRDRWNSLAFSPWLFGLQPSAACDYGTNGSRGRSADRRNVPHSRPLGRPDAIEWIRAMLAFHSSSHRWSAPRADGDWAECLVAEENDISDCGSYRFRSAIFRWVGRREQSSRKFPLRDCRCDLFHSWSHRFAAAGPEIRSSKIFTELLLARIDHKH